MAELDPRRHPIRDDLAAEYLRDRVTAPVYASPLAASVITETSAIRAAPAGTATQTSELLFGENVDVYEDQSGWSWVQGRADGYVGYVRSDDLQPGYAAPSHRVITRLSHLFPDADIKSPPVGRLTMGAEITITESGTRFSRLADGHHIMTAHILPVGEFLNDPIAVAMQCMDAPYLWGGRSSLGLDCSGLVQMAARMTGHTPPRDSDMLAAELGAALPLDTPPDALQPGDVVFFPGHCMIADGAGNLLHANAHHMKVTLEPLTVVFDRTEGGWSSVTALRRMVGA